MNSQILPAVWAYSVLIFLPLLVLGLIAEIFYSYWFKTQSYSFSDALCDLSFLGFNFWTSNHIAMMGPNASLPAYRMFHVFDMPDTYWVLIVTFIAVDFVWYWYHRAMHRWNVLWAIHATHHSVQKLNFLAAFRASWLMPLLNLVAFLPLTFLGLPPAFVGYCIFLNFAYQVFCHSDVIPRLRWLEGRVQTPADHRVHHSSDIGHLHSNYSGIFVIWDRIFGTYRRQTHDIKYGWALPAGERTANPITLSLKPLFDFFRGRLNY